ncbi:hypothetical protein HX89_07465 [Dermacoccus nishinomiyaensis]|uniref:Uncharacterized protein n=1 Tax=Dermacoccus nishinomiyaensis TaxID=1274 RepID=A0A075JEX2_9MICO|nr:hypothetical protein HX89_07465 [Dermacoccus nishinomiyaensis]
MTLVPAAAGVAVTLAGAGEAAERVVVGHLRAEPNRVDAPAGVLAPGRQGVAQSGVPGVDRGGVVDVERGDRHGIHSFIRPTEREERDLTRAGRCRAAARR